MKTVRIGTRGSQLALWQANEVSERLAGQGYRPEVVIIKTTGDKRQDVSLADIGGKGLFIKELEEALEHGRIDLAVHSLKDVPSLIPDQFTLAAFLKRGDPRDVWVHPDRAPIAGLPRGSVIGTSSPRRRAQLLERFPQFTVEQIRGNVETRIAKVRAGMYAGIILAAAGMTRLERDSEITSWFDVDEMVPAAGQGIVTLETLAANEAMIEAARSINYTASETAALCERGVLQRFGTRLDCYSAVAVHALTEAGETTVRAFFSDYEATRSIRVTERGRDPERLVTGVYEELVRRGAEELVCARR